MPRRSRSCRRRAQQHTYLGEELLRKLCLFFGSDRFDTAGVDALALDGVPLVREKVPHQHVADRAPDKVQVPEGLKEEEK